MLTAARAAGQGRAAGEAAAAEAAEREAVARNDASESRGAMAEAAPGVSASVEGGDGGESDATSLDR